VHGLYFEDLSLGQSAETTRPITAEDVEAFAAVSGDRNPVHLDDAYARTTPFGGRIAHGMLTGALISAVVSSKLPGPGAIYMSQQFRFRRPIKVGDLVTARVTVTALDEKKGRVTLATICQVDGRTAVDGEAVILAPRRGK
jgi:3-hydroxybutyryl-CoA dehydratase